MGKPDEVCEIVSGTKTVVFEAPELAPGQHTIDLFAVYSDVFSNVLTLTYTISDTVPGTFSLAYAGAFPLVFRLAGSVSLVPLRIEISGFRGTGPLQLQFSW
jgi:hypothetical protein